MPSRYTYADTIPVIMDEKGNFEPASSEHIGKGVKSIILIYKTAYQDLYKQSPQLKQAHPKPELYKDFEVILRNVILKNEFTDAKHFNQGLPKYPLELFKDKNGTVNYRLFNIVSDLLSNSEEYNGVIAEPRTSKSEYLQFYTGSLRDMILAHHMLLSDAQFTQNMDINFMRRLREDFHPRKVLSR